MTVEELLSGAYRFADAHDLAIAGALVVFPLLGTLLAWIGRGGKTDRDGIFIANAVVLVAATVFLVSVLAVFLGMSVRNRSLLDANVLLLVAPILCIAGSVFGVRRVFPTAELAGMATLRAIAAFVLACAIAWWIMLKFRGWGIVFFGSLVQLLVFVILGAVLLWVLWRRAFGRSR